MSPVETKIFDLLHFIPFSHTCSFCIKKSIVLLSGNNLDFNKMSSKVNNETELAEKCEIL